LTAMGAVYLRLVGSATDIYEQLEPLYADYRKLKLRFIDDDSCKILHMDEFVEMLLTLWILFVISSYHSLSIEMFWRRVASYLHIFLHLKRVRN
jgi:hypothetical protein